MDILDLLDSDEAALPKMRDPAKDFLAYLRDDVFQPFLDALASLDTADAITNSVIHHRDLCPTVCETLVASIDTYLKGFPHLAYAKVEEAISLLGPHFTALGAVGDMQNNLKYAYRIQESDADSLDRGRLFHIPFQMRDKVKTQRYSIPGLPSLYLGGSFFVCWAEYGRPELKDIHLSRLEAVGKLRLINFGYHPRRMAGLAATILGTGNDAAAPFVVAQTIAWPLLAACSIQVPDRTVAFKAEYIVPQIVLQWVRVQEEFDGIRYFSTHVDEILKDPVGQVNYVFPVQEPKETGYCDVLRSKFRLSEPYACRSFGDGGLMDFADCPNINFEIKRNGPHEAAQHYTMTDLGQIQQHVATLGTHHV
ncbi:hypothetical protein AB1L30_10345 [Bremerella sp. JC817]|uniref:hypothetical protein n=1 Tax=Bremerella sp. JC817 TaxID=3231756 RepID=UPI00345AA5ED